MALFVGFCSSSSPEGVLSWMRSAPSHKILGLSKVHGFNQEDVKAAFRKKVKKYHPDVYKGEEDAEAITQCLIQAYEELILEADPAMPNKTYIMNADPFEELEGDAEDIFVNEILCIGKACPYACVQRAPSVFKFNSDTGRAQAVVQGKGGEYTVQVAVDQCPRNCIHYVTPDQRKVLQELLNRALVDPYSLDYMTMQGLIARAKFENGKYRGPKRKPKRSENTVDYY